jgi:hypothetical protein
MRNTLVAAAVATALGAAASGAQAAQLQVKQYGSSAVVTVIERALFNNCTAASFVEYRDATVASAAGFTAGGGNYRTYTCTLATNANTSAASIAGLTLEYDERGAGGSWFGTVPVATGNATFGYLPTTATGCTNVGPVTIPGVGSITNAFACTAAATTTVAAAPDVGISDVEPAIFTIGGDIPSVGTPVTGAELANLNISPLLQQTFALGVSANIAAHITSLTTSQIVSIATGLYTDWHEIDPTDFTAGSTITICGRTPGSGTQAAVNAIFLRNPCAPTGSIPLASGAHFIANSSTGNLLSCLDNNTNAFGWYSVADGPRAADTFKDVQINGVTADASNAAVGSYDYAVETTLNAKLAGYSTNQGNFINLFMPTVLTQPTDLAQINAQLPAGAALNALQLNSTLAPTNPYSAATPVEWGSRNGSTCAPYQLSFP